MGEVVIGHFARGGDAAGIAETCEAYRVLLDDMLARLDALRGADAAWGDTVEIWIADARRLVGEINANAPLVRLAQQVASRLGPLRLALEAMERQRPHDVGQTDGAGGQGGGLIADLSSVNDDLKARCATLRGNNSGAPILHPVGPTAGSPERLKAGQALPIIAERTSLQSLGDEACSAIFHGAEVLRALAGMAVLGLAALRRSVRRLLSHVGLPHHAKSVSGTRLSVIRNDRPSFRPQPDDFFPGGGSAA